jgi:hypothetical protein
MPLEDTAKRQSRDAQKNVPVRRFAVRRRVVAALTQHAPPSRYTT